MKAKNNKNIPTYKERRFAEEYVENKGNATQAALKVYSAKDSKSASVIGSQNLAKVRVQREIKEILEEKGITEESIAKEMKRAIAEKPKKEITWSEKHQYIETALKLKGYLDKKENKSVGNIAIIIGDRLK